MIQQEEDLAFEKVEFENLSSTLEFLKQVRYDKWTGAQFLNKSNVWNVIFFFYKMFLTKCLVSEKIKFLSS